MDSRVAIEVMGLSVRPIRTICSRGMIDDIGTVSAPYKMRDGREGVSAKPIPHYSSDNGAACEVMGRMVDLGHVFIVKGDGLRNGDHSPRWTVLCDNMPRVDSDSLPLAICEMALSVMEQGKRGGYAGCQQE